MLLFSEAIVPELLRELCSNDMTPREHLEIQQALFKQFAEILDFTLKFDDLKVRAFYHHCLLSLISTFKRVLWSLNYCSVLHHFFLLQL